MTMNFGAGIRYKGQREAPTYRVRFAWALKELLPVPDGWRTLLTATEDGWATLDATSGHDGDAALQDNFLAQVEFTHAPYNDGLMSLGLTTCGHTDADSGPDQIPQFADHILDAESKPPTSELSSITHTTVMKLTAAAPSIDCQEDIDHALDSCLDLIHWTVDGLNAVTGRSWALPRPESEALGIIVWADQVQDRGLTRVLDPGLLLFSPWRHQVVSLDDRQLGALPHAQVESAQGHPISLVFRLKAEAVGALRRLGDSHTAIVMAQTTCEAWIDLLVCALLWDEGMTPAQAADALRTGESTLHRVNSLLQPRLGGPGWDANQNGEFRDWRKNLAEIRNLVVHGGFLPPLHVAEAAVEAMHNWIRFTLDRLCAPSTLRKYRMAAVIVARRAALEARGEWTKKMMKTADEADEYDYQGVFARWFYAVAAIRYPTLRSKPIEATATEMLVCLPDGTGYWVLHDEQAAQSALARIDAPDDRWSSSLYALDATHGLTVSFEEPPSLLRTGEWLDDYRLLPGVALMRDRREWWTPPDAPDDRLRLGE